MTFSPASRRRFLLASATGLGAFTFNRSGLSRPAPLRFAPAAFGAAGRVALIWIGDTGARRVRVDFGTDPNVRQHGPIVRLGRSTDFTAAVPLGRLSPGEIYYYRVADADSGEYLSDIGRFRTAPAVRRPFTFAFSADMHESHAPFRLFDVIAAHKPDFFLHLGDTVYADQPRAQFTPSLDHYRDKHAAIRADSPLQRFLARHLTYAIWDDHEIFENAHGAQEGIESARLAFREYWPCNPARPDGLYRRFGWAGTDFFILDTRSYRSPGGMPDGPRKTMLGAAQLKWFLDGLRTSSAPFKFVVTSVPFHGQDTESWGSYATERGQVLRTIREHAVSGVVFLTADYHMARDWTSNETGLHEYMAGPIAQNTHFQAVPSAREHYRRSDAFHFGDGHNFGLFRVDPAGRSARLEFINADGKVLYWKQFSLASSR